MEVGYYGFKEALVWSYSMYNQLNMMGSGPIYGYIKNEMKSDYG